MGLMRAACLAGSLANSCVLQLPARRSTAQAWRRLCFKLQSLRPALTTK